MIDPLLSAYVAALANGQTDLALTIAHLINAGTSCATTRRFTKIA
jgi:hypothetical protein